MCSYNTNLWTWRYSEVWSLAVQHLFFYSCFQKTYSMTIYMLQESASVNWLNTCHQYWCQIIKDEPNTIILEVICVGHILTALRVYCNGSFQCSFLISTHPTSLFQCRYNSAQPVLIQISWNLSCFVLLEQLNVPKKFWYCLNIMITL